MGWELERALAPLGEVVATDRSTLDLADLDAIRRVVRETKPEVIVNAAAYTAVDRAESEPKLAMRINGDAPGVLAEESKRLGALLVHYSTDYVFDGTKATPYVESDAPNPINAYGRSKLAGEKAIAAVGGSFLMLRTSWVYGHRGNNFLLTVLRKARSGERLRIVHDQHGAPTAASEIALATAQLLRSGGCEGLFHLSARGCTSWYEFAITALRCAKLEASVEAIESAQYAGPARRPRNSLLDCSELARRCRVQLAEWQVALVALLSQLRL